MSSSVFNLSSLQQNVNDYYTKIPRNTLVSMSRAFVIAFVIETAFTGNVVVGALGGAVSATATFIHALITPLFQELFPNYGMNDWGTEMLRTGVALISAACLAAAVGFVEPLEFISTTLIIHGFAIALIPPWRIANEAHVVFP